MLLSLNFNKKGKKNITYFYKYYVDLPPFFIKTILACC